MNRNEMKKNDKGDRRSGMERRRFSYSMHIPERRTGSKQTRDGEGLIKESTAYHQSILENLNQPVVVIDKDLNIVYSNNARNGNLNLSETSVIGKKCYTVTHGLDSPCWLHGIPVCPAMTSFEKNTKTVALHKHLINDAIVVEEIVSTPLNGSGFVISEFRNVNKLLGLNNGILVMCSSCMRVRDKDRAWYPLDSYIHRQTGADFSHSICNDCKGKLYPEI